MRILISLSSMTAASWDRLPKAEKREYLKKHPKSKFAEPSAGHRSTLVDSMRGASTLKEAKKVARQLAEHDSKAKKDEYEVAKTRAKKSATADSTASLKKQIKDLEKQKRALWSVVAPLKKKTQKFNPDAVQAKKDKSAYKKAYEDWDKVNQKFLAVKGKLQLLGA